MCLQGKERNWINNQTGNWIQDKLNFFFLINQNVSKLQIILIPLSFKADKKNVKKEKRRWFTAGEKTEHCDTRINDVIRRNFEKSCSREINL